MISGNDEICGHNRLRNSETLLLEDDSQTFLDVVLGPLGLAQTRSQKGHLNLS